MQETGQKGVVFILAPVPTDEDEDDIARYRQNTPYDEQDESEIERDEQPESYWRSTWNTHQAQHSFSEGAHSNE